MTQKLVCSVNISGILVVERYLVDQDYEITLIKLVYLSTKWNVQL